MAKWVFLIFVSFNQETEVVEIEFQSRSLCQGGAPVILQEYKKVLPAHAKVHGICLQTARALPDDD